MTPIARSQRSASSTSMSNASLGSSPLHRLASYFEKARTRAGTITLPGKTLDTIKQYREQCEQHSGREVDAIVRALGPSGTDVYRRLDSTALLVICSVLVHTESCLAQQRGLCLLAETLHDNPGTSSQTATGRQGKKIAIGKQALVSLVKGFIKTEETKQTRRWMGVLALELLRGCVPNAILLRDHVQTLQSLNHIIEHERDQVLKLLSGSMIQSLLSAGVKPEIIWPSKRSIDLYSQFPRTDCYETQWITAFEGFVEDIGDSDVLPQEKTCVMFAFALSIGTDRYVTDDVSAILVTISDELNIIIPKSAIGPAKYIDVPLDRVHSATVATSANSQSQTPSYVLIMNLAIVDGTTCYLNASGSESSPVSLVFVDEKDARILLQLIQPRTVDETQVGYHSQSEPLDVSQHYWDDQSEDELANPLNRDNHDANVVSAGPMASLNPAHQQPSNTVQHAERNVLVAMGVDVSQPAPPDDRQVDAAEGKSPSPAVEDLGQPHRADSLSSLQRNGIGESIEPHKTAKADAVSAEVQHPRNQADDYDNLYDVSPRGLENRPGPIRPRPSSPQLPPLPNDNLNQPIHTSTRVLSDIPRATSVSPDATADSISLKPKFTGPSNETIGPPTNGDISKDNAMPQELRRGTRNIQDRLAHEDQVATSPRSHPFSEQVAQKTTTSNSQLKRKAGSPKQLKPSKRPAVEKNKARSRVELSNTGDEYDLEPSPEPTKPIHTMAPASSKMSVRGGQLQSSREQISNAKRSAAGLASKTSDLRSKVTSTAEGSKPRPQKDDGSKSRASQAPPQLLNNKTSNPPPVRKGKQAGVWPPTAAKTKNFSRPPAKTKVGPKSAAAPPAAPRSRRAAAIKANKKLQGQDESDEITDVDEFENIIPTIEPSPITKKTTKTSDPRSQLNRPVPIVESGGRQAGSVSQPGVQIPQSVEGSKDTSRADVTPRRRRIPALDSKRDTKRVEETDKVEESPLPLANGTHGDSRVTKPDISVDRGAPSLQAKPMEKEVIAMEPEPIPGTGREHPQKGNERPERPACTEEVADSEENMTPNVLSQHFPQQASIGMVGDTEDRHFQEAMLEVDNEPLNHDQAQDTGTGVTRSDMPNESHSPRQMKINSQSPHIEQAPKPGVAAKEVKSFDVLANRVKTLPQDHKGAVATIPKINGEYPHSSVAQRSLQAAKVPKSINKAKVVRKHEDQEQNGDHHRAQDPFEAKLGALFSKQPQKKSFPQPEGQPIEQLTKNEKTKETVAPAPSAVDTIRRPSKQGTALHKDKSSEAMRQAKPASNARKTAQGNMSSKSSHAINGVHTKAIVEEQVSTSQTPLPTLSSKPGLISWTASGPRNQGILSGKKRTPLEEISVRNSDTTKSKLEHSGNDKKSMATLLDDSPLEDDQGPWHEPQLNGTPLHNPKAVPPMRPKLQVSVVHEKAHRLSSQSTRVDANGSPIPCGDRLHQATRHEAKTDHLEFDFGDDQTLVEADGQRGTVSKLPPVRHHVMSGVEDDAFASMTSNRKQVPSSPHAPSTLGTMPPHVVLGNGDMVNRKTLESIVSKVPQDPFIEANPRPPSSFMKLLHKSNAAEKKRKSGDLEGKKSHDITNSKPVAVADDPDMTLVEPEPKRRKRNHRTVLVFSSSPPSSPSETASKDETPTNVESDQESESPTTRWRKGLEPHQCNVLDALSVITHQLVRHLVDKETAAKDMIKDYEIGGDNLLQAYEKERRKKLETRAASLQHEKKRLTTMYTQAQGNVHKLSKDLKKRSARALGDRLVQREQQQHDLDSAIENAIAACT